MYVIIINTYIYVLWGVHVSPLVLGLVKTLALRQARLPRENGKAARRPCSSRLMIGLKAAEPILA